MDVNQDKPSARVLVEPLDQLCVAAFVEARPCGLDPEACRRAVTVQQETEPFL